MTTIQKCEPARLFHHIRDLEKTITQAFPNIWGPVQLILGAWATRWLPGQQKPMRVNLVGKATLGSETVIEIFQDVQDASLTLGNIPHLDQLTWETWTSQWGNGVHFLDVDERCGETLEERMEQSGLDLTPPPYEDRLRICRRAVKQFLAIMKETYIGGVVWDHDPENLEWIQRLANLQATLREQPSGSIFESLNILGQGVVLLEVEANGELHSLVNVTVSSMPPPFGRIFFDLINYESETIEYWRMEHLLKAYPSTSAYQIMKKLDQLGIMEYVQLDDEETSYCKFREEWSWVNGYRINLWQTLGCMGQQCVFNILEYQHEVR